MSAETKRRQVRWRSFVKTHNLLIFVLVTQSYFCFIAFMFFFFTSENLRKFFVFYFCSFSTRHLNLLSNLLSFKCFNSWFRSRSLLNPVASRSCSRIFGIAWNQRGKLCDIPSIRRCDGSSRRIQTSMWTPWLLSFRSQTSWAPQKTWLPSHC